MFRRGYLAVAGMGIAAGVAAWLWWAPGAANEPPPPQDGSLEYESSRLREIKSRPMLEGLGEYDGTERHGAADTRHAEVAASDATQDAMKDPVWRDYPTIGLDAAELMRRFRAAPATIRASQLFRHPALNEKDRYISAPLRYELECVLAVVRPTLRDLVSVKSAAMKKEMAAAVRDGRAVPARTFRDVAGNLVILEGEHILIENGVALSASSKDLPLTTEVIEYQGFVGLTLGTSVLHWFMVHGMLGEDGYRNNMSLLFEGKPSQRSK